MINEIETRMFAAIMSSADLIWHGHRNQSPAQIDPSFSFIFTMNSLSRREEETLLKTTKAHALRECDAVVKGTALC
jgi:hypothetical protein